MKKGIVISGVLGGKNNNIFQAYSSVTENLVDNWDDLIKRGFIKECKQLKEAQEIVDKAKANVKVKDIWGKEEPTEEPTEDQVVILKDKYNTKQLKEILDNYEIEYASSSDKTELCQLIIDNNLDEQLVRYGNRGYEKYHYQ